MNNIINFEEKKIDKIKSLLAYIKSIQNDLIGIDVDCFYF